jgi:hypothetical protein
LETKIPKQRFTFESFREGEVYLTFCEIRQPAEQMTLPSLQLPLLLRKLQHRPQSREISSIDSTNCTNPLAEESAIVLHNLDGGQHVSINNSGPKVASDTGVLLMSEGEFNCQFDILIGLWPNSPKMREDLPGRPHYQTCPLTSST